MKKRLSVFLLMLSLLLTACGGTINTTENSEKLQVVTSFYPMYLLAQAVTEGATELELMNMAQPQTGCLHDYELTISDMKLLEGADVLIINGGGMEGFLEQAVERYPDLVIVDTSHGIELLEEEEHHHHEGEEEHAEHAHSHEGNPHIWLSPERAAHQAEVMATVLGELDEADAELFLKNAETKTAKTGILAEQLIKGRNIIVIILSRFDESVLVDIIAGTVQPKPIRNGTKLLPDKPIFLKRLSIINEILAI